MTNDGPVTTAIDAIIKSCGKGGSVSHAGNARRSDYDFLLSCPISVPYDQLCDLSKIVHENCNAHEYEGWIVADGSGQGERFELSQVANWLLRESCLRSASEAWDDFKHFLNYKSGESLLVQLIYGITIDEKIVLDDNTDLVPFGGIPDSVQKTAFQVRHSPCKLWGDGDILPCALIHHIPMCPILFRPDAQKEFKEHKKKASERQENAEGVLAALTLLGPPGPFGSGSWTQASGRGVPWSGGLNFALSGDNFRVGGWNLISPTPQQCRDIYNLYMQTELDLRKSLLPALRRLNGSYKKPGVDSAVDLRMSLESALIASGTAELRYRIAASGAWLLEPDNADNRRALFTRLQKVYDFCSKAVHVGQIKENDVSIEEAQELTRKMILALFERNKPRDFIFLNL